MQKSGTILKRHVIRGRSFCHAQRPLACTQRAFLIGL